MKSGLLKFTGAFEAVGDSVWFLEHRRFLLRKNSSSLHEDRAMFFNSVLIDPFHITSRGLARDQFFA